MRIITSILLLAFLSSIVGVPAFAADRPNVLLICVDDLKPLLGCYGDTTVKSPNIDRLAARGMRFDRAYCNQAVCAPSRNALLTGLRPQSLGIYDLGTNFRKAVARRGDAAAAFQGTTAIGRRGWGRSFTSGMATMTIALRGACRIGMPMSFVTRCRRAARERADSRGGAVLQRTWATGRPASAGAAYESADVPDTAYPDGQLADEAIRRLQTAAKNPDQPFFIAVGFVKPHLPFCAPKKVLGPVRSRKLRAARAAHAAGRRTRFRSHELGRAAAIFTHAGIGRLA